MSVLQKAWRRAIRAITGRILRDAGIANAESRRSHAVKSARVGAKLFAMTSPDHTATIDDAYAWLDNHPRYSVADLGNAAGSIFRTDEWEFTGRWQPSRRLTNHQRYVRVWRLRTPAQPRHGYEEKGAVAA